MNCNLSRLIIVTALCFMSFNSFCRAGIKTNTDGACNRLLADCRGGDKPEARNNLFSQPKDNGDATCGVRQTLISEHVLSGNDDFYADILAIWQRIYAQTMLDYPHGVPKTNPSAQLTQLFEKPLPVVYTEAAVKAADGGPLTPPSSIVNTLKEDGFQLVSYYVDESALTSIFGADFVNDELSFIGQTFPEAQRIDVNATTSPATLRAMLDNASSYYIVVVNNGWHWIGVTTTIVYDSLNAVAVADTSNFGKLNGEPSETSFNSFTGLVFEVR